MSPVNRFPWRRFLALCLLLVFSISCRDVLGPEKMPVAVVDGKVSQGGKPVTRGWIEFVPIDGTVGVMRSAQLRADGTFHATKVPVGLNLIRLVNIDVDSNRIRWKFGAFTSPIRRTIALNTNPPVNIDVVEEYLKLTQSPPKDKLSDERGAR